MANLNPHFERLKRAYIFPIIEQKVEELKNTCPSATLLNFGIGDVALPLAPTIAQAISRAVMEMTTPEGMRGYGPSVGYLFLREAIAREEFAPFGIGPDEIFVSDGANSDGVDIQELFHLSDSVGITDPTYPPYLDTLILAGRQKIHFLPCLPENHFTPLPPKEHCDIIYLCTPNNPTGVAMTRSELQRWVDYARANDSLLLIDCAYAAFITSPDVPRTVFELPGAKECAIEFRSFSKSAGFTGLRCGYTILPKTVQVRLDGKRLPLYPFWERRQATKFNGVAYPIQRGALAGYSPEGKVETRAQVELYLVQARRLKEGLSARGFTCYGGVDSPYLWWKTPDGITDWEFFDALLQKCHLMCIPGTGFGAAGAGYVRLSAFTTPEKASLALERLHLL